jgi:hypothetical protein
MSALLALLLVSAWPKNMATSMAGLSLEANKLTYVAWHDSRTRYFAFKSWECDGSHRAVLLTKDRRNMSGAGFNMSRFGRSSEAGYTEVTDRTVKPATSHGIGIGMTKAQVIRKLGKPLKSRTEGKEFWCAMYKTVKPGQVLRNLYTFKDAKLIEIALRLDSVPGCGEDSLSDEGWPWTHF